MQDISNLEIKDINYVRRYMSNLQVFIYVWVYVTLDIFL